MAITSYCDIELAVQGESQSIIRGSMLTQTLVFVECKQSDASSRFTEYSSANNRSVLVIDEASQGLCLIAEIYLSHMSKRSPSLPDV